MNTETIYNTGELCPQCQAELMEHEDGVIRCERCSYHEYDVDDFGSLTTGEGE